MEIVRFNVPLRGCKPRPAQYWCCGTSIVCADRDLRNKGIIYNKGFEHGVQSGGWVVLMTSEMGSSYVEMTKHVEYMIKA
jgi:hypothetical protein